MMNRCLAEARPFRTSGGGRGRAVLAGSLSCILSLAALVVSRPSLAGEPQNEPAANSTTPCRVLADERVREPLEAIAAEYRRRTGAEIQLAFLSLDRLDALMRTSQPAHDVVVSMAADGKRQDETAVASLSGAKKVAWKHPTGEPVWAAALTRHPQANPFFRFLGGATGHRLWSESEAGFTITSGPNRAEAYEWVVQNRTGHSYPVTAARMLRECGIREGVCIDIGCGAGHLDVELAQRSKLTIFGLDIDPDVQPLFEKRMRGAGLQDRVSFVLGDAQQLPFPDDYADVIVSRGTLIFIPDIGKCLREVDRVLKPTGVAFLGGRYVYTPQAYKISTGELRKIVEETKISGAQVIEARGQWVKIVGPQAQESARQFHSGPQMLAGRVVADYAIRQGRCLLICRADGGLEQALQQGFLENTDLKITALYATAESAAEAERRIRAANLAERVTCATGEVSAIPFKEGSFDVVAGVGPILLWGDREQAMREIYRVLRKGGAALVGGQYRHMPDWRRVSSETLRASAAKTGIPAIRVSDDMGQWVEIRKGIKDRRFQD